MAAELADFEAAGREGDQRDGLRAPITSVAAVLVAPVFDRAPDEQTDEDKHGHERRDARDEEDPVIHIRGSASALSCARAEDQNAGEDRSHACAQRGCCLEPCHGASLYPLAR